MYAMIDSGEKGYLGKKKNTYNEILRYTKE